MIRKYHRTLTVTSRHNDNKCKAASSLFRVKMIGKLERTQSNAYQNKDQHRIPTNNGRYINQQQQNNHLRTDNNLSHLGGGGGGLNAFYYFTGTKSSSYILLLLKHKNCLAWTKNKTLTHNECE